MNSRSPIPTRPWSASAGRRIRVARLRRPCGVRERRPNKTKLVRLAPIRPDRAGDAIERAFDQFGHQQPTVVDRARHGYPALRHRLEPDAAVIGLVADEEDETVSRLPGVIQRAVEQRAADAAL